jgi:hypothetical protein
MTSSRSSSSSAWSCQPVRAGCRGVATRRTAGLESLILEPLDVGLRDRALRPPAQTTAYTSTTAARRRACQVILGNYQVVLHRVCLDFNVYCRRSAEADFV